MLQPMPPHACTPMQGLQGPGNRTLYPLAPPITLGSNAHRRCTTTLHLPPSPCLHLLPAISPCLHPSSPPLLPAPISSLCLHLPSNPSSCLTHLHARRCHQLHSSVTKLPLLHPCGTLTTATHHRRTLWTSVGNSMDDICANLSATPFVQMGRPTTSNLTPARPAPAPPAHSGIYFIIAYGTRLGTAQIAPLSPLPALPGRTPASIADGCTCRPSPPKTTATPSAHCALARHMLIRPCTGFHECIAVS